MLNTGRAGALVALLAMVIASEGMAQGRGETVLSRPRPEVDPLGIIAGSFILRPQVSLATEYNDNIFADDTSEVSDTIITVSPEFRAASDWSRHAIGMRLAGTVFRYLDRSNENIEDLSFTTNGRLDITGDTNAFAGAGFEYLHEDRGSPNDVDGLEPTRYSILGGQLGGNQRFNRLTLSLLLQARHLDYDDVAAVGGAVNNDDRDRDEFDASLRASYQFSPGYGAFVEALGRVRDYDDTFDDNGFQRSSTGYGARAGVTFELTDLVFGEVFGDVQREEYDDSRFSSNTSTSIGVDVGWNVTTLTTISLAAAQSIEETTVANASGFTATRGSLRVDHELLRTVLLNAHVTGLRNDFDGINRQDDTIDAGFGVTYLMNRYLHWNAGYTYTQRDSDALGVDYTRNVVRVQGRLQF